MADAPSDAVVAGFVRDGYAVGSRLVSEEERRAVLDDADRFARGEYPTLNRADVGLPVDPVETAAPASILAVHFPHWVSPICLRMITHPGVAGWVQRLAGAHLPVWDGAVKCMQTMLFVKPPGLPGQAWHQDERFIPTRDRSLVGAWIALDDATIENGCLWVLPRSHAQGRLWPTRPHDDLDEYDATDSAYGFDADAARPIEVAAGDVVFFNGYLLHKSLRNRSAGARRALVNHYCNAWSKLPWAIPPTTVSSMAIPQLDFRMVVPIGEDPYADDGYDESPSAVFLRPYEADQS